MKRQFLYVITATSALYWAKPASSQDVRTQAPCSPVINQTRGNVTVTFGGGCTVGITPAELKDIVENLLARGAVPLDRFEMLTRAFGVTETALTTFFRILGENNVATEDLDAKLREIAARHITLVKQVEPAAGDDPQVAVIKQQAAAAISAGDYGRAQALLQAAFDADLAAACRARDAAIKRLLAAAKTRADMGELRISQFQYAAATR